MPRKLFFTFPINDPYNSDPLEAGFLNAQWVQLSPFPQITKIKFLKPCQKIRCIGASKNQIPTHIPFLKKVLSLLTLAIRSILWHSGLTWILMRQVGRDKKYTKMKRKTNNHEAELMKDTRNLHNSSCSHVWCAREKSSEGVLNSSKALNLNLIHLNSTKAFFKKREKRSLQSSVSNLSFLERPAEKADLRLAVIECRMLLKFGGPGGEWREERHWYPTIASFKLPIN